MDNDLPVNLRLLQNFLHVAQAASFRDASSKIHRSTSVVSTQVKQLEEQVGARLFHRTTRSVALTPEGELLRQAVRSGFREIESGLRQLQETLDLRVGRIAIASSPIMAASFLPPLLARFEAEYPSIHIQVRELTPSEIAHNLSNADADFGLGPQPESRALSFQPLLQDDIVALVPRKFRPDGGDTITLRELARYPTLQLGQATALRSLLQQAARRQGIELQPKYESTQAQTLIAMANEQLGAAILPASVVPAKGNPRVRVLRIVNPALRRPVGLITWPQRSMSPAAARLAAMIVQSRSR